MRALASGQACVESDREDRTKWMGKYRSRGKRTKTKTPKHTRTVWTGVEREVKRKEYDAAIAAASTASGAAAPATSSSSTNELSGASAKSKLEHRSNDDRSTTWKDPVCANSK